MTGRRGGSILLAVLVVIVLAALAGTTVIAMADAQRSSASVSLDREQLRALAWAGVRAAMAKLETQRGELIGGATPEFAEELVAFESGGWKFEARLLPLSEGGSLAAAENGKLDSNTVTAEMLAKVPGLGEAAAGKIAAARGPGFGGLDELAKASGLALKAWYGVTESTGTSLDGGPGRQTGGGPADLVTVYSFDPAVQTGVGRGAETNAGRRRVALPGALSEEIGKALRERLSEGSATAIENTVKGGTTVKKPSDLVKALRAGGVPATAWDEVLDLFAVSPDPYATGLVNVNEAPASVLACVPGIDSAAAERLVGMRGSMDAVSKRRVTWPLTGGVMTEEQFVLAVDWLCTRTLQWRVRVEATAVRQDAERGAGAGVGDGVRVPLRRFVLEAVIDVASTRARAASIRDVTYLDVAVTAAEVAANDEKAAEGAGGVTEPPVEPPAGAPKPPVQAKSESAGEEWSVEPKVEAPEPPAEAGGGEVGPPAPGRDLRVGRWRVGR